jgi:uncharacterized membrane protein HdeD (DUF308 family)/uncharacterized membrane protein YjdF
MATHAVAASGWDRRRLIYGDWTWLVRDGLDVFRLVFIAGTVAFAIQGRSTAVALAAASAVVLVGRVIDLPRWFDLGLLVALTLIAWGTALSLYGDWFYYDKVVHGISPVGYTPVLYLALVRLGVVPDPGRAITERRVARISGILVVTLAVGMAVGSAYESIEWIEDKFFGGHFVKGLWDTETDLLCDTGGSLVGALFLTVWALRGWTSRRTTVVRVPGPRETLGEAATERLRPAPGSVVATWEHRLAGLPMAAQGVVAIAGGVLLLAWSSPSLRTVGIVFGIGLLGYAAFEVYGLARDRDPVERAGSAAALVALTVAGTLLLAWPTISQLTVLYVTGAAAVAYAVTEAASLATAARTSRQRWLGGASSVVALVFGIALLAEPRGSLHTTIMLLGLFLIVLGAIRLVRAADVWRRHRTA